MEKRRKTELTLTVFLEDEFSLVVVIIVLTPPPVLSSLSLVLRHGGKWHKKAETLKLVVCAGGVSELFCSEFGERQGREGRGGEVWR